MRIVVALLPMYRRARVLLPAVSAHASALSENSNNSNTSKCYLKTARSGRTEMVVDRLRRGRRAVAVHFCTGATAAVTRLQAARGGGGKSPSHRRRCRLQCSRGSSDLLNSRGKRTDMTYTRGRSSWRPRARNRLGSVALWKLQFVLICTGDDRMRACFAFPPGKHRVYTHNVYVLECAGGELGVFYFSLSLSLHPSLCVYTFIYIHLVRSLFRYTSLLHPPCTLSPFCTE